MPHDAGPLTTMALLRAGLRRSPRRNAAAILVSLIAASALFMAITLFAGMQRTLEGNMQALSAEIILTPQGMAAVADQLLTTGAAPPLAPTIPVTEWRRKLREARVVGIRTVEGQDLSEGGAGASTDTMASIILVHLEEWASPMIAIQEVGAAIPEADVVVAEQTTRQVARQLEPIVRYLFVGAGIALLAAMLMTGLLTTMRVGERRGELGMMRAVGATRASLMRLTLAETGFLAATGGLGGVLLGLVMVVLLPGEAVRHLAAVEALLYGGGSALVTVVVALLAAAPPAVQAAHLDPLEAARRGR